MIYYIYRTEIALTKKEERRFKVKSVIALSDKELKIILGGLIMRIETEAHANEEIKEITKRLIEKLENEIGE